MKSPDYVATRLARQWRSADYREARLLDKGALDTAGFNASAWPLIFSIGKPSSRALIENLGAVRAHIHAWRDLAVGEVIWEPVIFRSASEPISVPVQWILHTPSDWIAAINNIQIASEFERLAHLREGANPLFQRLLIRQESLWRDRSDKDVLLALQLAMNLSQGCAQGLPLRALALSGIDSKFYERNRQLIIQLLDIRFDGVVSQQGLEQFLGAAQDNHHWLLVVDLDGSLLPFRQIRVSDKDLLETALPGTHLLIVENERCHHQLSRCSNTLAILGAGQNLAWMAASWLSTKQLAYWGDIDTWGLHMLAQARNYQPDLTPLLMSKNIFELHGNNKVVVEAEPIRALPAKGLTESELQLFSFLLLQEKGRLEQEFIAKESVVQAIRQWVM